MSVPCTPKDLTPNLQYDPHPSHILQCTSSTLISPHTIFTWFGTPVLINLSYRDFFPVPCSDKMVADYFSTSEYACNHLLPPCEKQASWRYHYPLQLMLYFNNAMLGTPMGISIQLMTSPSFWTLTLHSLPHIRPQIIADHHQWLNISQSLPWAAILQILQMDQLLLCQWWGLCPRHSSSNAPMSHTEPTNGRSIVRTALQILWESIVI